MDNENSVAVSFLNLQLTYSLLSSGGVGGGGVQGGTCYTTPRTLTHLQQGTKLRYKYWTNIGQILDKYWANIADYKHDHI